MKRRRKGLVIAVAAVCLLALLNGLGALGRPFWMDEAITIMEFASRPTPFDVYLSYDIPNNHILFTIILQLWMDVLEYFGMLQAFLLRIPSLFFGVVATALLCLAAIRRGGRIAGATLAAFLALSSSFALYATAVRGYMLSLLCVAAALIIVKPLLRRGGMRLNAAYFGVCLLAVGTIPTNALSLEAAALLSFPFAWRSQRRKLRIAWLFAAPVAALVIFYLPILPKFINCLSLHEGWSSAISAFWNLYISFDLAFLPLLPLCIWGAVSLWKRRPSRRLERICSTAALLLPMPFLFLPGTVPFPRVFFPLWAVWIVLMARPLRESFSLLKTHVPSIKPALLCGVLLCLCAAITIHGRQAIRDTLFQDGLHDDLFMPRYMESGFRPDAMAAKISELIKGEPGLKVFVSFQADHFATILHGNMLGMPEDTWLYDSPRLGRLLLLPDNEETLIVCTGPGDLEEAIARFKLKEVKPLADLGVQQLYAVAPQRQP